MGARATRPDGVEAAGSRVGQIGRRCTTLAKEAGNVVFASGKLTKDTYTVTFSTDLVGINGIRLEALSDPRLPMKGPGRAPNGNQVLNELHVAVAPKKDSAKSQPVKLENAVADYSQNGWHVSGAIDGDLGTGWAIDNQQGRDHFAVFECHEAVGAAGGSIITVTLDQQYPDGNHELGKFRLSVTTAKHPSRQENLPGNIAAILKFPSDKRTAAQKTELAAYYRSLDPDVNRLLQAVAQHANDRANARQLGAQDLVWALLNSPAFLFNCSCRGRC